MKLQNPDNFYAFHESISERADSSHLDNWPINSLVELANQRADKWKNVAIIVSLISILLILWQAIWVYGYSENRVSKEVLITKPEVTAPTDEIEARFLQMTHVLRYLLGQVKRYETILGSQNLESYNPNVGGHKNEIGRAPSFKRAVVTATKANVRPVPNTESEPIMTLDNGAEILVDLKEEDWNRIITPTGQRAWISSKVIDFRDDR